jgi:hypothetical protein
MSPGDVTAAERATAAASRNLLTRAFRPDTGAGPFARAAASRHLHAGTPGVAGISMGQQWGRRKHGEGNATHRTRTIAQGRVRMRAPITKPTSGRSMSAGALIPISTSRRSMSASAPTTIPTSRTLSRAFVAASSSANMACHRRTMTRFWRNRTACARPAESRRKRRSVSIIAMRLAPSAGSCVASAISHWAASGTARPR